MSKETIEHQLFREGKINEEEYIKLREKREKKFASKLCVINPDDTEMIQKMRNLKRNKRESDIEEG